MCIKYAWLPREKSPGVLDSHCVICDDTCTASSPEAIYIIHQKLTMVLESAVSGKGRRVLNCGSTYNRRGLSLLKANTRKRLIYSLRA